MKYFYSLQDNLEKQDVGAKAYNLAKLLQHNLPVPTGYVLKASVVLQSLAVKDCSDLKNELAQVLTKINSPYVMVRSTFGAEDSSSKSFAGQFDSYQVDNDVEEVYEHLKRCQSVYSKDLTGYAESSNNNNGGAVIIQAMIQPEYAGVIFAKSSKILHLEYVGGHAEKLVQGEVTPTSLQIALPLHPDTLKACPFNLSKLVNLVTKIRAIYADIPQDIEWVIAGNKFNIVQTRPITSDDQKIIWSNTNVNENYPCALSPLLLSIARQSYYHYFKNIFIKFDLMPKSSSDFYEEKFANIIGAWSEHMYYNISNIHELLHSIPFGDRLSNSFDNFVGYQEGNGTNNYSVSLYKKIKFVLQITGSYFFVETNLKKFEREVERFANQTVATNLVSHLSKMFHWFLNIRFHRWLNAAMADLYAMLTHGVLNELCKHIDPNNKGLANDLVQGCEIISYQPLIELYNIRKQINANVDFKVLFENNSAKDICSKLASQDYTTLAKSINDYLDKWGYRCSGELMFLNENYSENPISFITMLKKYHASSSRAPQEIFAQTKVKQKLLNIKTSKAIMQLTKFSWIKKLFLLLGYKLILPAARRSISWRERARIKQALLYYKFKQNMQYFENILLAQGLLKNKDDIFFLNYQEINQLLSGEEAHGSYLSNIIDLRKHKKSEAQQKANNLVSILGDNQQVWSYNSTNTTSGRLNGLPASGGIITARAKVLTSVHDIDKLAEGDILITKQTDPGWVSIFPLISGLVTENGGVLSHGAIVAREFAIPAVVGVPAITQKIKDGQTITIDGFSGEISCQE